MTSIRVIPGLKSSDYTRHRLHGDDCVWVEKNCYIDLWIEMLHALKLEPLAMLPSTLAVDFEGDQWTFYKPSHDELRELYGIDVQELNVWRSLLEHALEHLSAGKLISTEVDAFWLPDTFGTDYRRKHTKTTIVLNDLDVDRCQLGYFHNAGYFELSGEDFEELFRLNRPNRPEYLPFFAEIVRLDRMTSRPYGELIQLSQALCRKHLARLPNSNPMKRFKERFSADLPQLQAKGLDYYHAWAFGTIRQVGAAFDLAAASVRWMDANLDDAAEAFAMISELSKTLILKVARAVNTGRKFNDLSIFDKLEETWNRGMNSLNQKLVQSTSN